MKTHKGVKILLFLFCFVYLTEVNAKEESNQLAEIQFDSLLQLAWDEFNIDRDKSLKIALNLHEAYRGLDINRKFKTLYLIGYIYQHENYFDQAANQYFLALDLLKSKVDVTNIERKVYLLQNLGVVYEKTFQYDNSLRYMSDALELAKKIDNHNSLGELYYNIAVIHRKKGDYDAAVNFHYKSINVGEVNKNSYLIAKVYNSLGLVYDEKKEYTLARKSYKKAIELADSNKSLVGDLAMFQSNLGENYFLQSEYDLAKKHYFSALETSTKLNDTDKKKWILNNIADVFMKENNYSEAISYYKKSIELGNPDAIDEELQRANKNISHAYEQLGEYKLALEFKSGYLAQADKIIALKEDLAQQNAQYRMKELDWQRELMAKEVLLASAEKENFWGRLMLGISLALILFGSRLTYVYYRKIYKARKLLEYY